MADLSISVGDRTVEASWADENGELRQAIADALPLAGDATRWGDELYFSIPVEVEPETTREVVPVGAVAYWPTGNALCLFWGPTPASQDAEPRAAGPVAVVADIADTSALSDLEGGARVRIEAGTGPD